MTDPFFRLDAVHTLTCALMLLNTDLHGHVSTHQCAVYVRLCVCICEDVCICVCMSFPVYGCVYCWQAGLPSHKTDKWREWKVWRATFSSKPLLMNSVDSFLKYKTQTDHQLISACRSASWTPVINPLLFQSKPPFVNLGHWRLLSVILQLCR